MTSRVVTLLGVHVYLEGTSGTMVLEYVLE
jgi:hypothetical protein